jgi:hypothetical protein
MSKAKSEPIEDYLDEDEPVSGQKYALVSFLSPENVLEKKDLFFFQRFLQSYEVEWKVKNMEAFLAEQVNEINRGLDEKANKFDASGVNDAADLCRASRIKMETVMESYQGFVRKQQKDINKTKIGDAWEDFLFKEQAKLEEEFHAKNDFRTSIRGFKVRAVARDEKEAEVRAKKLQKSDKYHNIYCAEVGKWTPWDPKPHLVADQEYAQDELNNLMKKYKENEDSKSAFFEEQRKTGMKPKAEKAMFGITKTDENETVTEEASAAAQSEATNTIFNGPADLVLERKMKKKAEEDAKKVEEKPAEEKPTENTA